MRTSHTLCTLVFGGTTVFGAACADLNQSDAGARASDTQELASQNGLKSINGFRAHNGLTLGAGINLLNGLRSIDGLSPTTGLLTTADGRNTVSYLVRCALPANHSITKTVAGISYSFKGQIGLAPAWEDGACDTDCQEQVTACLLAHVNSTGQHISIWLDGDNPALGWGRSGAFPYQEGSFFGNIFISEPAAYYCNGEDFDLGTVPGRLGADQTDSPYSDPFGSAALCSKYCTAANSTLDGYTLCGGYKHVVTAYRDWDPNTDYKICARSTGTCLSIVNSFPADGAAITLGSYTQAASQKFRITRVSDGIYKICGTQSGKCLSPSGSSLQQKTYSGAGQQWRVTPHVGAYGFYFTCSVGAGTCAAMNNASLELDPFHNITAQEWSIGIAN